MQFRDFLAILGKRWVILLGSVVLVLASAVWVTLSMTPTYRATTRIFLTASEGGTVVSTQDLGTFVELLGSPVVQDPLRKTLGLAPGTPINLVGVVSENAPILEVTARSSSPTLAADLANAVGPQLAKIGAKYLPLLASTGQDIEATAITPAVAPSAPESPSLSTNVALGLLAGLGLGVGIALMRHFLDTRIRGDMDLRALSDRPLLGSLRRIKDVERNSLVVETEPHGRAAEEFRRLRTNLQFVDVATGGRHSFAVTSAVSGEGKTTTAVNLALATAASGARVLLVDADMRHPSVADTMGLDGGVGLTTLLLGRASLAEVAQPWRDTTLDVLPAGEIPPNPSELLGSAPMKRLFEEFLDTYDFVIVDSPPIVPVVDPVLISRLVGGMLMVVSVDRSLKRDVAAALKQLKTVEVQVSGFALNLLHGGDAYGRYGYYVYGQAKRAKKPRKLRSSAEPARAARPAEDPAELGESAPLSEPAQEPAS